MRLVLVVLVVAGCEGPTVIVQPAPVSFPEPDSTAEPDGDPTVDTAAVTDTGADTGTELPVFGFDIEGVAIDLGTGMPAFEGLCVDLLDPTSALTGGIPTVVSSATVGVAGIFELPGVVTTSSVGLLLSIDDCSVGGGVYPTRTPIPPSAYTSLDEGDVLSGQLVHSVPTNLLTAFATSATSTGYSGNLAADGFLFGFAIDASGAPLSLVTVGCAGGCENTLYLDPDGSDGLFASHGTINRSTDAAAVGLFLIPAAPTTTYSANDGGRHVFPDQLNGSSPGSATVMPMVAQ